MAAAKVPMSSVPLNAEPSVLVLPASPLNVASVDFGVALCVAQAPSPPVLTARTRTRYSVPLSRPEMESEATVPVWPASTQPDAAEGVWPVCTAASSATMPVPVFGAEV